MKIKQDEPQFTPITITLETRKEAEALWFAIRDVKNAEELSRIGRSIPICRTGSRTSRGCDSH